MTSKELHAQRVADLIKAAEENTKVAFNIAQIQKDIAAIQTAMKDMANNDKGYALKTEIDPTTKDHENRLRRLEIWGFTAIGILLALQFYFSYIHKN